MHRQKDFGRLVITTMVNAIFSGMCALVLICRHRPVNPDSCGVGMLLFAVLS